MTARWQKLIESYDLKVPKDRGALWTSLDVVRGQETVLKGMQVASSVARFERLYTLEMKLGPTGFFETYHTEFGGAKNAVTGNIWKLLSTKYAAGLEGRVTIIVDSRNPRSLQAIADKLELARVEKNPALKARLIAEADGLSSTKALTEELLSLNKKITSFRWIDLSGKEISYEVKLGIDH